LTGTPSDQHQRRAGRVAAQEDAGLLADAAALDEAHAGHEGQRIGEGDVAALLDLAAGLSR
jgi:hypothetical protein